MFILGLVIGLFAGVVLMCILQINRQNENEQILEEKKSETKFKEIVDLKEKSRLVKLNDLIDEYRKGKNIYTVMRDITNLVKGW